jgi:hypothetical protein
MGREQRGEERKTPQEKAFFLIYQEYTEEDADWKLEAMAALEKGNNAAKFTLAPESERDSILRKLMKN